MPPDFVLARRWDSTAAVGVAVLVVDVTALEGLAYMATHVPLRS